MRKIVIAVVALLCSGVAQASIVPPRNGGGSGGSGSYTLPNATNATTGGVSVPAGTCLAVNGSGALTCALTQSMINTALGYTPATSSVFTSSTAGMVPASGGGAINFLRADGTFAVPNAGVTSVTAGTGLNGGTITGVGSISVIYGAAANTAAMGNDTRIVNALPQSGGTMTGALALFTGSTGITQANGDSSTKLATDQFVASAVAGLSGGGGYTLPAATTSTSGGVIVGAGLNVTGNGTLSVGYAPGFAPIQTLTYGSTVTDTVSNGSIATLTLTGNATFAVSGMVAGGTYQVRLVQDGTGSRVITWPNSSTFKWPGGTAGVLSTAANAVDVLTFTSFDGTTATCVLSKAFQ